jgi:UDP-3-O-[3-hydroxymyristoyl] glucosamine N-acyltransferase
VRADQLAEALGGLVEGDGGAELHGIADLREAGPGQLAFLANPRYRRFLATSGAQVLLVGPEVQLEGRTLIRVSDPYLAFAQALRLFHPQPWPSAGIHPRAFVHPEARLDQGVALEPFAVVQAGAVVGEGTWLQSGAYVGAGARIGRDCRLMPNAVVMDGCALGDRVWLNPGAVVGSQGFGFAPGPEGLVKIPQPGPAIVEDDVEIGANSCVDRAALGQTRVRRGAKLDNLCQVGHAAEVGAHGVLVAYSGVAGSSRLGAGVTLAARSSVLGHLEIGDGTVVAAHSMVARDTGPGDRVSGVPARDHGSWLRSSRVEAHQLQRELRALRKRLDELEARAESEESR